VHNYVLNDFSKAEMLWVAALCEAVADNIEYLVRGEDATFQNKLHIALQAKGYVT
jgi:peptidyl-tRNA hydrolase, PTH1 family